MDTERPVFLDVDTGVDDALAIVLALRTQTLRLVGVTTVSGNTSSLQAARNTRFLCREFAPDPSVPVVAGATHALNGSVPEIDPMIHGADGLGGVYRAHAGGDSRAETASGDCAVDALLDAAAKYGDALTVVATGPLTNLALAARRDRRALASVGRILVMGGALDVAGNVTPHAEFNTYSDPEAYEALLADGVSIELFPLDVTRKVSLLRSTLTEDLGLPAHELSLLREMTAGYMDFHRRRSGLDGAHIHDALPVAAAAGWGGFRYRSGLVQIDATAGEERGRTAWATRKAGTPWRVAVDLDAGEFLEWYWGKVATRRSR